MSKAIGYMVVWCDGEGLFGPYGQDPGNPHCLQASHLEPVLFASHADAKKAIRCSMALAKLQDECGEMVNEDWLPANKSAIRIIPVFAWPKGSQQQ